MSVIGFSTIPVMRNLQELAFTFGTKIEVSTR